MQTQMTLVIRQGGTSTVVDTRCHVCISSIVKALELGISLDSDSAVILCEKHGEIIQKALEGQHG